MKYLMALQAVSITFSYFETSSMARVRPGNPMKRSRARHLNQGYPASIYDSSPCLLRNWCAALIKQCWNVSRGVRSSLSSSKVFFKVRVLTSETPAENTILSPFLMFSSKYPGTYKSSLKSYPRSCSFGYHIYRAPRTDLKRRIFLLLCRLRRLTASCPRIRRKHLFPL